jgi:putative phosphoserine phosphatase/1-acylglycerol-3-phosphate O-acyltransferase
MRGAAFFDLDRTLLPGGTGQALSHAMLDLGLIPRTLPGEDLLFKVFDTVGETLPSMVLARQATRVAKGRAADAFDAAADAAAAVIDEMVHPFARPLIEQHRDAGRLVVLATTTPDHLVRPIAERLGFDDVVATTYAVGADGMFDGSIAGRFVWSRGKLAAVRAFARERGISMAESYAYSDSIYDVPLLGAVGHPTAVNPDPRLALLAVARRWPILSLDVPPGVLKIPVVGLELQQLLFLAMRPELFPYARFDIQGVENIPRSGPAIVAGNHRSYFDVPALVITMARSGRTARALGKKELFDIPVFGGFATALGGISVDRTGDAAGSIDAAERALDGGEIVLVLPQGTIPRGERFFDPVLTGHTGAARLAAATRAPVVPVGIWGSERVWPRSAALPNMLSLAHPPTVTVRVGPPVELKYRSPAADTRRIMAAISDCLPAQARQPHTPTAEELRRSYPGGRLPGEDAVAPGEDGGRS